MKKYVNIQTMETNDVKDFRKVSQKRNFYMPNDSGRVFLLGIVLPFVISLIIAYIAIVVKRGQGDTRTETQILNALYDKLWFYILMALLSQVSYLAIVLCYNSVCRIKFSACNLHLKKAKAAPSFVSIALGIIAILGFIVFVEGVLGNMFSKLGISGAGYALEHTNVGLLILDLFLLGIIPPICEEIFFRGLLYNGLKKNFKPFVSVVISALLFALMHQNITQFVYQFVLGIALAQIMERTNNLLYPMLLHMSNNLFTILLSYMFEKGVINYNFAKMPWWMYIVGVLLALLACAIFYVVDRFFFAKQKKVEEEAVDIKEEDGTEAKTQVVAANGKLPLSIIIGMVLCVVIIVINAI